MLLEDPHLSVVVVLHCILRPVDPQLLPQRRCNEGPLSAHFFASSEYQLHFIAHYRLLVEVRLKIVVVPLPQLLSCPEGAS